MNSETQILLHLTGVMTLIQHLYIQWELICAAHYVINKENDDASS